jgi:uncharacterized membrane protein
MNKRVFIASTLAAAVAAPSLVSAQTPAPAPSFKAEKCYGLAKAGKNDCASNRQQFVCRHVQGQRRSEGLDLRP